VSRSVPLIGVSYPGPDVGLGTLLNTRQSRRDFGAVALESVAFVVRQAFWTRAQGEGLQEGRRHKAMPSAGALHPIKCVLFRSGNDVLLFDDDEDEFVQVAVKHPLSMEDLLRRCREVLPRADGYWLLLLADFDLTSDHYENPTSLIWRDAGAALQTLALVAEANRLAFCPLGILGQEGAIALLGDSDRYVAVGVCAIGRRLDVQTASES
jgi:hypothetical protein